MTWTKIDDRMPDDFLELSDAAFRLHVSATVYANRVSLDGRIAKARLTAVPVPPKTRRPAIIAELVTAGRWIDDGDGWILVDFFEGQPSKEEVEAVREWDKLRQRVRFARNDAPLRDQLQAEERAAFVVLQAARERRRARSSLRSPDGIRTESQRPVPLRPDPARPAPSEDEAEDERRPRPTGPLGVVGRAADRMCPGCVCFIGRDEETIAARHDGRVVEWHVRCLKDWIGDFPEAEREMRIDPAVPLTTDRDAATIQQQIDAVLRGETA